MVLFLNEILHACPPGRLPALTHPKTKPFQELEHLSSVVYDHPMKYNTICLRPALTIIAVFCLTHTALTKENSDHLLFSFDDSFDPATVEARDVIVSLHKSGNNNGLKMDTGHAQDWPGITLKPQQGTWDLSPYSSVIMDVANIDSKPATICWRVDNNGADGSKNCLTGTLKLDAGKNGTLEVNLATSPWKLPEGIKLEGMRGAPGSEKLDPSRITQFLVFVPKPKDSHSFVIDNIRASGTVKQIKVQNFLPFVDTFGQLIHDDWPGKIHNETELKASIAAEDLDFKKHPGPKHWNKYGGWADGPSLEATGNFRTAKYNGKWSLVDPEGRLFWSHGVDCIGFGSANTPISDRESYFADLPKTPEFKEFYGKGHWAPHGFYKDKPKPYKTYNFTSANLFRKYGPDWQTSCFDLAHKRLRSWNMNTIGNWSDNKIAGMKKTPYVTTIHFSSPEIEGSEGYWGRFPDPFDPKFREELRKRLNGDKDRTASDPMCIGYFVHNELAWGDKLSLAKASLASPATQESKKAFITELKKRYASIDKLNNAWKTSYQSWEAMAESKDLPDINNAGSDLESFASALAEQYFRVCREEVKSIAPNTLYLGCRFAWANDIAVKASSKFCDVISFNLYRKDISDFKVPADIDMPVIVGEFHFGALDRGMFHTGLVPMPDQAARAMAYRDYVEGALRNQFIVGTHWFQYGDQALTGRGDGENYQIGLLTVCDIPYPETIAAVRDVGDQMYKIRFGK